jgi:hypothetical protein
MFQSIVHYFEKAITYLFYDYSLEDISLRYYNKFENPSEYDIEAQNDNIETHHTISYMTYLFPREIDYLLV